MEEQDAFPAVICEHKLSQDFSLLEEKNSSLKHSYISNNNLALTMGADCTEISTSSTPNKLIANDNNSGSPILLQKNCVLKRSAKPQTKFMARRMKGLLVKARSKRNNFKQITLALSDNVLHKVSKSLHADGLTLQSNMANSEDLTNTDIGTFPDAEETVVYKEKQRYAFVTFPSCTVDDKVITAFVEDHFLVLVQELQISFWSFVERKSQWLHLGSLPRQHFVGGISTGFQNSRINISNEKMLMCMELWTSYEKEQTALICVMYSFKIIQARFRFCCLELKRLHGYIKNIQFCILPEFSLVVSWSHCDDAISTKIVKFIIDSESQLILKSTELVPVTGTVNSLHFLKDCRAIVIGESTSQIFLWNHCTGVLVKIIQCPRKDVRLQWADEDQGFLFAAVTTLTHVELATANITTGKWKQVRKYLLPEASKLTGISVERGKMTVVFLEGFMCWDLRSDVLMSETDNIEED